MKDIISVLTFVLVFEIFISHVKLYDLTCPSESHWKSRAKVKCNSTLMYVCLYNNVKEIYVERCNGPDWDRKGSKRIFSGSFTRGNCSENRYQPMIFQTNGSMSDCVFIKSICNEEGQIAYKDNSTKVDRTCRCDHTNNYSFIKSPNNYRFCIPSEEDCSCYKKTCLLNYTLSADYECIKNDYHNETNYEKRNRHRETLDSRDQVKLENTHVWSNDTTLKIYMKKHRAVNILTIFGAVTICLAVLITKLTIYKRCRMCQKGYLSIEEIYYLRLVRLLYNEANPVVRTIFDSVIVPDELRTTLDRYKPLLEKQYRDTENGINDFQWNLLYKPIQGKTVTSQDFDIRLMLLLLRSLANYKISDSYKDKYDASINAKFSRIKYVRNEIARRFEGKLSKSLFIRYLNDISQAVQETTEISQADTRQIDCFDVKCVKTPKELQILEETIVPTTEENNFLVVYYVIATIVYPTIRKKYIACAQLDRNSAVIHQTHCSGKESKNLYLRYMINYLKHRDEEKGQSGYIVHLDVIKDIQREIVQSSSGVLTEKRFNKILTSMQEAVLCLGGTFSEEKLVELQQIKCILERN